MSHTPATQGPLIPFVRPYFEAESTLWDTLRQALHRGQVTNHGPLVQSLERAAAEWLNCDAISAVATGSAGLLLGAHALNLRGTVVLPAFTYIATLNAVLHAGATPLFCDVEPGRWTLCPDALGELMAEHTVDGVVAVNAFGVPPNLAKIRALIDDRPLLYDNAHGFGTDVEGIRVGQQADVEVHSLHATKVLPALEGGLVRCAAPRVRERIEVLRNHGQTPDPLDSVAGFNAKLNEFSAAVALSNLSAFDGVLARRRAYCSTLRAGLKALGFGLQSIPSGVASSCQNLVVRCPGDRSAIAQRFFQAGVETRPYFGVMLHQLKRFEHPVSLPNTEALGPSVLALPLHSRMEDAVIDRILDAAKGAVTPLPTADASD